MSEGHGDLSTWPQALGFASGMLVMAFALSAFFPVPWVLLGHWLEERMKIKRILAEARLQEAKNAAVSRPTGDQP